MSEAPITAKCDAAMVLSAVGDAIGYKNGSWEFSKSGKAIVAEANTLGGIEKVMVSLPGWMVSDDTVMHLATAEAVVEWKPEKNLTKLYQLVCAKYVECWDDMTGRAPGIQCGKAMPTLKRKHWDGVAFSNAGGGCGAAMRTMCLGLVWNHPDQLEDLIAISTECGRMTHNHPTGFWGGMVAAVFTAYAVQGLPIHTWGAKLMDEVMPLAVKYLKTDGRDWDTYQANNALEYFPAKWEEYLNLRHIRDGKNPPVFPGEFGVVERDAFYKSISFSGWGGSSGHDAVIIAYDALLGCNGDWIEFLNRGALHGGDSDSTAAIGGAWYGVLYGKVNVPENHYKKLEYLDRTQALATKLAHMAEVIYTAKL